MEMSRYLEMYNDKFYIYPSFEQNLYYLIKLFCNEVVQLNGEGVLAKPPEEVMDYFQRKYCDPGRVVKLNKDQAEIRINQKIFAFKAFAENTGRNVHKQSYDDGTYVEFAIPFEGNSELFFVKPLGFETKIQFSVLAQPPPQSVSLQKRFSSLDEKAIIEQCEKDAEAVSELAIHINQEYIEMGKQFFNGVFRLANHPTRIFSSQRAALDYCYSYLLFNPLLNRIFNLTS
jgi:hypothetical protein